ncbi:hypothetical protein PTI98_013642 [Pleurotus ostreatus]|nr:hypothetical protein PTI98_013642 [Pleurotus ostreatus]
MSNEKETELTVNVEISEDVFSERREGLKEMYYRPLTQVSLLGFVCFMCPGLFNALNGLGAGGQGDSTISANANAAHYATFAFAAFFAGSVNNVLGSKLTLLIGSTGYALYIGSFLQFQSHQYPSECRWFRCCLWCHLGHMCRLAMDRSRLAHVGVPDRKSERPLYRSFLDHIQPRRCCRSLGLVRSKLPL